MLIGCHIEPIYNFFFEIARAVWKINRVKVKGCFGPKIVKSMNEIKKFVKLKSVAPGADLTSNLRRHWAAPSFCTQRTAVQSGDFPFWANTCWKNPVLVCSLLRRDLYKNVGKEARSSPAPITQEPDTSSSFLNLITDINDKDN